MGENNKSIYVFFIMSSLGLYGLSLYNHLLFHTFVELFSIFIGLMIFIIAVNSRVYIKRSSLLLVGIAYLYIGIFDLMHVFTFEDFGFFEAGINQSSQFWVIARLMESLTLLIVLAIPTIYLRINHRIIYLSYSVISIIMMYLILSGNLLPDLYIVGGGQTAIKYILEYSIIIIFSLATMYVIKSDLSKHYKFVLIVTLSLKIISEIFFIMINEVYIIFTVLGHIAKYLSFAGIYIIYVTETIKAPYSNVFHFYKAKELELIHRAEIDELTGLFNHSTIYSKIEEAIDKIGFECRKISLLIFDIDNFKEINDTYGHLKGDEILKKIGDLLNSYDQIEKIAGRYGGDEFVLIFRDHNELELKKIGTILRNRFKELSKDIGIEITCSMGAVIWKFGDNPTDLIRKADTKMYQAKREEKGSLRIWEPEYTK